MAKISWSISGEEIASCNCAWGCPCQFNALPTTGRCEAFVAWRMGGHFGARPLRASCSPASCGYQVPCTKATGRPSHRR